MDTDKVISYIVDWLTQYLDSSGLHIHHIRELKENNLRISCRHFVRIQDVTTGA